jgi:glycerol-3-phosphate acyltransferase PlsY
MAKVANISSLAALVSMLLAPLFIWLLWPSTPLIVTQALITVLLFWRHRSNIQKLLKGGEGKISRKSGRDTS